MPGKPSPDRLTNSVPASDEQVQAKVRSGDRLEIIVHAGRDGLRISAPRQPGMSAWFRDVRGQAYETALSHGRLAVIAALVTAFVLLTGLPRYPYSFLPEEAYSSLRAAELIRNGLRGGEAQQVLPAFFQGQAGPASLGGTSVYLQFFPQLFGFTSLGWVRSFNAILSLLGLGFLAWVLRHIYRLEHAWALLPLAAGLPLWYHFSRSGAPAVQAAVFTAAAAGSYGLYRSGDGRWLSAAALLAWLAFFTSPAMGITLSIGLVLLLASDFRYHRTQLRLWVQAAALSLPFLAALVRFLLASPGAVQRQLEAQNSVLAAGTTLADGTALFLTRLWQIANPFFWTAGGDDFPRTYALAGPPAGPLVVLLAGWGLWRALKGWRGWENRLMIIALFCAAVGPALAGAGTGDILPYALVQAVLAVSGLHALIAFVSSRWPGMPAWLPGAALLIGLTVTSLGLFARVMSAGVLRTHELGRSGLQYGAPHVFQAAQQYARRFPQRTVLISPEWSEDFEALLRFFVSRPGTVRSGTVADFQHTVRPEIKDRAFLVTAENYYELAADPKFILTTQAAIYSPDGRPVFYLAELAYAADIQQLLAEEAARRRMLVAGQVEIQGRQHPVRHSRFDLGEVAFLFDGDLSTLARTAGANPLVVEIEFPDPRRLAGLRLHVGAEPVTLTAAVVQAEDGQVRTFSTRAGQVDDYKSVEIFFGTTHSASRLRIELYDDNAQEPTHVHLWEIVLIEPDS